jgi:hypothetical protein
MDSFATLENEPILNKSKCGLQGMSLCNPEVLGSNLKTEAICSSKTLVPICQNNPEDNNMNLHHL